MIDAEDERLTGEIKLFKAKADQVVSERHKRRCAKWGLKPGSIVVPKNGKFIGKRCLVESLSTDHMRHPQDKPYAIVFVELADGTFSKSRVTLFGNYDVRDDGRRVLLEVRKDLEAL